MPITPRSGAQLFPNPLVLAGFRGLNKQAEGAILDPSWATEATNCVFDSAGRLAVRKGFVSQNGTTISGSPTISQLFEYRKKDGTTELIYSTSNSKIYKNASTPSDITGTATITVGNDWQFVNFNDKVYGFQQGEQPIVYSGASFADLTATSGSAPTGNCAVAYSGRVWAADSDKQTIKYSALLDAAKWAVVDGAGSIDLTSVWPYGMDSIVAMAVFNGNLVIFGKNTILFYTDGTGSSLGINPTNMYLYDHIGSTGCIARDTIKEVEGADFLFLSTSGVQSLQRLIQEKSNPIENISKNIRDYIIAYVSLETNSIKIKAEYSPQNSFYLLSFPSSSKAFCFDTRSKMEDGTFRVTEWDTLVPAAMVATVSGSLYVGVNAVAGKVGLYTGYLDNSATIGFVYSSGWMDFGQDFAIYLKILKSMSAVVFSSTATPVSLKWDVDFEGNFSSGSFTTVAGGSAEYNVAEYNIAEFSGGVILTKGKVAADGTGQYVRVGANATINNSQFSLQQISLYSKLGRLAN